MSFRRQATHQTLAMQHNSAIGQEVHDLATPCVFASRLLGCRLEVLTQPCGWTPTPRQLLSLSTKPAISKSAQHVSTAREQKLPRARMPARQQCTLPPPLHLLRPPAVHGAMATAAHATTS